VIPGHEPIGRISVMDAPSSALRGLKEGDRVAVHGVTPCGICSRCREGGRCAEAFAHGFRPADQGSGLWGGFSEWMEITARTKLFPISEALPIEDALLFNPLAAGFNWTLELGGLKLGQSVLVLGSGQRGLACVLAARAAGARAIIVTGLRRDQFKLDIARTFGATETLVAGEDDVVKRVRAATNGQGVDLVIDTTPLAFQPVRDAIRAVQAGGTIVLGGLKGNQRMQDFPIDDLLNKRVHIVGALGSSEWGTRQAIAFIESGAAPLHLMHTHHFGLDRVAHAIELLAGEIADEAALHISILP
jgi:threonine dehydrogenase-like Zn-dependent dehydrogenase